MSRIRLSSIIDVSANLDAIAERVQLHDEKLALAIDQISDGLGQRKLSFDVLDKISGEVQKFDEKLALGLDMITDHLQKLGQEGV